MLIDGLELCGSLVDYWDVFISCLDSHFDGTHSLQWIHWWASDVMLNFSKSILMKKQTHESTFFWGGWAIRITHDNICIHCDCRDGGKACFSYFILFYWRIKTLCSSYRNACGNLFLLIFLLPQPHCQIHMASGDIHPTAFFSDNGSENKRILISLCLFNASSWWAEKMAERENLQNGCCLKYTLFHMW